MPRHGRMTTERAKDFKGTLRQLLAAMSKYKLSLVVVIVFAVLSTIFNIAGPKILAKATTALATGWIAKLRGVGGILFVVLFGNLLAFNLYMSGVKLIGPEKSVLYGFSEPVTAAILAVALLSTPFTLWDALGFAAVFAMLVVLSFGGKRHTERLPE